MVPIGMNGTRTYINMFTWGAMDRALGTALRGNARVRPTKAAVPGAVQGVAVLAAVRVATGHRA